MLDITTLKTRIVLQRLRDYDGDNDYLLKLKKKLIIEKNVIFTPSQSEYILKNIDTEPIKIEKVVEITSFFGEQLKESENLKKIPEKVYIDSILSENEKSYHVKGKFWKNQTDFNLFYIPKSQLMNDIFDDSIPPEDVDVNFEYYNSIHKRGWSIFKHQEVGIKFLLSRKKCILADSMGLGKTTQSIVAALASEAKKILIICPANAKINWMREIMYYLEGDDVKIISGKKWVSGSRFTIINYDILKNFHTVKDNRKKYNEDEVKRDIINENFDLMILDEAQFLKNSNAERTKIVNQISKNIERTWLLTGTPIANRPMDYYNLLHLCDSPVTQNWRTYAFRYCAAKQFKKKTKAGNLVDIWVTDGASNLDELNLRTKNLILRRKKEDHLELPPKIVAPYFIELENELEYDNVFQEYLDWSESEGKTLGAGRHMVELVVLRKYLALEKIKHTVELATQAIENGQKVIIFTNFTEPFNLLMESFGKLAVGHNGKMNMIQKQNSIDRFQNDPKVMVFIGNLISAGTAITLTEAQVVIMNDLDFVPSNHAQAEDRCWRIGTTKTVNVYYPIVQNTIDEMMFDMLEKKKNISSQILGDEYVKMEISEDLINSLLGNN